MKKTRRKYLDLFDDNRRWKYYFCIKILWRKKDICTDKINKLIGFFPRVLMLAPLQVQHSVGEHPVYHRDLGTKGHFPESWWTGSPYSRSSESHTAISDGVLVGGLV